jgi:hypothetical protein
MATTDDPCFTASAFCTFPNVFMKHGAAIFFFHCCTDLVLKIVDLACPYVPDGTHAP